MYLIPGIFYKFVYSCVFSMPKNSPNVPSSFAAFGLYKHKVVIMYENYVYT